MKHLAHQCAHVFQRNAAQKLEGHVKIAVVYDRDHRIANASPINAGRLFLIRIGHPLPLRSWWFLWCTVQRAIKVPRVNALLSSER